MSNSGRNVTKLQQWIVRKHGNIKAVPKANNNKRNRNKIIQQKFDQRINLYRQYNNK